MCFSASASFVAGGSLTVLGTASWQLARKKERLIALVPFIFAAQQVSEGFQWLTIMRGGPSNLFAYIYIFFAFLFWPIYVPLTVYNLDKKSREIQKWFLMGGLLLSWVLLLTLINNPLYVDVVNRCISYDIESVLPLLIAGFYVLVVCGSMIVSKIRAIRFFGVAVLFFALFTAGLYRSNFVSVWCFFAALLSGLIYLYFRDLRRK